MLGTREKLTEESHDSYVIKCILLILPITLLYYPGKSNSSDSNKAYIYAEIYILLNINMKQPQTVNRVSL